MSCYLKTGETWVVMMHAYHIKTSRLDSIEHAKLEHATINVG
jgi:hypothetical protein